MACFQEFRSDILRFGDYKTKELQKMGIESLKNKYNELLEHQQQLAKVKFRNDYLDEMIRRTRHILEDRGEDLRAPENLAEPSKNSG